MSFEKVPNFRKFFDISTVSSEMGIYKFKTFRLEVAERRLFHDGSPVSLTPKAFDTLVYLVERAGHLVEKDELIQAVWPDSFIEEGNLSRTISTLRKTLGQDNNENKFIETVPTKGYRFVAEAETATSETEPSGTSNGLADISPRAASPLPGQVFATETSVGSSGRRMLLIVAALVISIVSVTGLWMSNGLLPRSFVARIGKHSINGEAYRNYQEGRFLLETHTPENNKKAVEKFEKAVELDPHYAEAYAAIADAKTASSPGVHSNDDNASARAAVKKALELDPDSSYAHTINCRIMSPYDWEFEEAVAECQRAVALDPNDAGAHRELGLALNVVGRSDEALSEMAAAIAISPTSAIKRDRGLVLYMARRYDEAIEQFQQAEATDPEYVDGYKWLMLAFAMKNDYANAFDNLVKFDESQGATPEDINAATSAFATGGWPAAVSVALDAHSGIGTKRTFMVADLHAQIGEKDKAFDVINDMQKGRVLMMGMVPRDPMLDPIRDDPRFDTLLTQMKLK